MILSKPRTFLIDLATSVIYTLFLVMLKCAVIADIFNFFKLFFEDREKTAFYIKVFLSFINVTIFSKKSYNTSVILNC